ATEKIARKQDWPEPFRQGQAVAARQSAIPLNLQGRSLTPGSATHRASAYIARAEAHSGPVSLPPIGHRKRPSLRARPTARCAVIERSGRYGHRAKAAGPFHRPTASSPAVLLPKKARRGPATQNRY